MQFPIASKGKPLLTILLIALFAGTLDITENLVFNQLRGVTPTMVFEYIASGLIGLRAFRGGLLTVGLGVAIQYMIAFFWTAVFYAASRRFPILSRRPVINGLVYGGVIYVFMYFIVLPLSSVPPPLRPVTILVRVNAVLAHLLLVGLPISLLVKRDLSDGGQYEAGC